MAGFFLLAILLAAGKLDAATEFHDVDGNGVNETINITGSTVKITSPSTGISRTYETGYWTSVQYAELDGNPGDEILFVNRTTGSTAKTWIISFASNQVKLYDGGFPNGLRLEDMDGKPGLEVVTISVSSVNGIANPGKVTIITDRTRSVITYDVGKPRALEYVELDGKPGMEILFTNVYTLNGTPSAAQATVVTHATGDVKTYDVGSPNAMRFVQLTGDTPQQVLFTNLRSLNGIPAAAKATVLNHKTRTVETCDVGSPNAMQLVQLDGNSGNEVLFTNLSSFNGAPSAAIATVLAYRTETTIVRHWFDLSLNYETHETLAATSFDVGKPGHMELANLDEKPGNEVLFTNLSTLNGSPNQAQATVIAYRSAPSDPGTPIFFFNDLSTTSQTPTVTTYDVGRPGHMELANLDGKPGSEVLFTNISTFNGSPNTAQATILTYGVNEVKTYDVGSPSYMQFQDLDGHGEDQLVFTNIRTLNGSPFPATATVLTHRTRSVHTYDVGRPSFLRFAELDGFPGNEMLFTNIYIINGIPLPSTATVVGDRAQLVKTFDVGRPTGSTIAEVNGKPGNEVIFTSSTGDVIVSFYDFLPSVDVWTIRFFAASANDPLVAGSSADPDHDGYSNFMERAFGGNPLVAETIGPASSMMKGGDGKTRLTVRFRRPIGGDGITYRMELSTDLKNWDSSGTQIQQVGSAEPTGDGKTEWISLQTKTDAATFGTVYGRIKVSQ